MQVAEALDAGLWMLVVGCFVSTGEVVRERIEKY